MQDSNEERELTEADIADAQAQAHIDALQRERDGYARYGREDRVKECDAAIKAAASARKSARAVAPEIETAVVADPPETATPPAKKAAARKTAAKKTAEG